MLDQSYIKIDNKDKRMLTKLRDNQISDMNRAIKNSKDLANIINPVYAN